MRSFATIAALLAAALLSPAAATPCPEGCECLHSMYVLCEGTDVDEPPFGLWPGITYLDLSFNRISSLDRYSFSGFPDVRTAYLAKNNLTVLDLEVFTTTPRIYEINVNFNNIDTILMPSPGNQLTSLMLLNLIGTKIHSLDPASLQAALPRLDALYISDTPLADECKYEGLYWWAQSRGIVLYEFLCSFEAQQACYAPCSCSGAQMVCYDTGLTHPPVGLWPDHTHLHFGGNRVSQLFEYSFTGFPNLRSVHFASNAMTTFAWEAFAAVPELEFVDYSGNEIDALHAPPEGVQLSKVTDLALSATNIASLDVSVLEEGFPSLRTLYVDNTPLACACSYKELRAWAQEKGVALSVLCSNVVCPV